MLLHEGMWGRGECLPFIRGLRLLTVFVSSFRDFYRVFNNIWHIWKWHSISPSPRSPSPGSTLINPAPREMTFVNRDREKIKWKVTAEVFTFPFVERIRCSVLYLSSGLVRSDLKFTSVALRDLWFHTLLTKTGLFDAPRACFSLQPQYPLYHDIFSLLAIQLAGLRSYERSCNSHCFQ